MKTILFMFTRSVYKFYNVFDNDGITLTSKVESLSELKIIFRKFNH